jgi:hypothetical protein
MDPFAAIGLASNVVQFVDFSTKLLGAVHTIRHSESGSTAENEHLSVVIGQMKQFSYALQPKKVAFPQSEEEQSREKLASECYILSEEFVHLLENIKTKNPRSLRESARAAIANVRFKNEKDELRQRLHECSTQLNLHLTHMKRSELLSGSPFNKF